MNLVLSLTCVLLKFLHLNFIKLGYLISNISKYSHTLHLLYMSPCINMPTKSPCLNLPIFNLVSVINIGGWWGRGQGAISNSLFLIKFHLFNIQTKFT